MTACACEPTETQGGLAAQPSQVGGDNSSSGNTQYRLRRELWTAVIRALNHSELPYCLLGAEGDLPGLADSDMDFAVRPCDYQAVPQLLAAAAAGVGGHLVQVIRHETTATYFALAKQQGDMVAFLNPDCTTDYRRHGRLWMSADQLLRERRRVAGGYFRPSPDIDFKYYLTKQVLKQTLSDAQWKKLAALYAASAQPQQALARWPREPANQIERALLQNDREGFRNLARRLKCELNRAPRQESASAAMSSFIRDAARLVSRVARPTGLFVRISGGGLEERTALAWQLTKLLAPAFRRTWVVTSCNAAKVMRALVESTLVVSPNETIPFPLLPGAVDLRWRSAASASENLELAIATVLSYLSKRTMRRLELQSHRSAGPDLTELAETRVF